MQLIKKIWVRVLISLLFGGFVTEIIHIKTGNPTDVPVMPLAFLSFLLLTALVWLDNYKYYFFPNRYSKNDKKNNDDIIDDEI